MAEACRIHSDAAIAMCNALVDLADAGSGAGAIALYYAASVPAYCDDAAGTEVARCTCSDPAYAAAAADGSNHWADANLTAAAQDTDATGNASAITHFRLEDSDSNGYIQGTCGISTGYNLNFNSTTISAHSQVDITQLEVRVPYNQA